MTRQELIDEMANRLNFRSLDECENMKQKDSWFTERGRALVMIEFLESEGLLKDMDQ